MMSGVETLHGQTTNQYIGMILSLVNGEIQLETLCRSPQYLSVYIALWKDPRAGILVDDIHKITTVPKSTIQRALNDFETVGLVSFRFITKPVEYFERCGKHDAGGPRPKLWRLSGPVKAEA